MAAAQIASDKKYFVLPYTNGRINSNAEIIEQSRNAAPEDKTRHPFPRPSLRSPQPPPEEEGANKLLREFFAKDDVQAMTEISLELSQKLSDAVGKMPAFPKSVHRILELSRDINCSPKELVSIIEKDPVMTMKLLHIINSSYYSFPKQITSVSQSIVYIGLNTVKNMALSFAVIGALPQHNSAGFDMQRYLMHSLITASLARILCQKFSKDGTDPGDCNLAGLLHDFGQVVFAQFMPEEFKKAISYSAKNSVPLYIAERQTIGVDHGVVGAMLAERWKFPHNLCDAIRHHHDASLQKTTLQNCVFVANRLSKHKLFSSNINYNHNRLLEDLPPAIARRFGGNWGEIIVELGDLSNIVSDALAFAHISKDIQP